MMLLRLLAAAGSTVLLLGCGSNDDGQAAAPPTQTATPSATTTQAAAETQNRVVSQGIRLDEVTGGEGRPIATLTNLNDLAVDASVTIDIYTGGDLPGYELTGQARLAPESTGEVELSEMRGQTVTCEGTCSYGFSARTEQAEPLGDEPYNTETTCTPEVCMLGAEATPAPTS